MASRSRVFESPTPVPADLADESPAPSSRTASTRLAPVTPAAISTWPLFARFAIPWRRAFSTRGWRIRVGTIARRALSSKALAFFGILAACGYIPRPVEGVPSGAPWEALPLRKWLAEDRAEPQALSFCAPPACAPGLAVGVVRLKGWDADVTRALLQDPERLARALRSSAGRDKPVETAISVKRLNSTPYIGFTIGLAPRNDGKPPAYGAALGRPSGESLDVVLVIGNDPASVQETVRRVAEHEWSS